MGSCTETARPGPTGGSCTETADSWRHLETLRTVDWQSATRRVQKGHHLFYAASPGTSGPGMDATGAKRPPFVFQNATGIGGAWEKNGR